MTADAFGLAGLNVSCFSGKDFAPASVLVSLADAALESNDQAKACENLWEASRKLRGDRDVAIELVASGKVRSLTEMVLRMRNMTKSDFLQSYRYERECLCVREMAVSVLHELCFYREGCVAVASSMTALSEIISLPLTKFQTWMKSDYLNINEIGQLEQVLVDLFGRLLYGLRHTGDSGDTCAEARDSLVSTCIHL